MPPVTKKAFSKNSVLSSPYSLFGIPFSNSPPTPLNKKPRKAAGRGRGQKKLAQAVKLPRNVKTANKRLAHLESSAVNLPPISECRVVLEKLDLFSSEDAVSPTPVDENTNQNVGDDQRMLSKRWSLAVDSEESLDKSPLPSSDSPSENRIFRYDRSVRNGTDGGQSSSTAVRGSSRIKSQSQPRTSQFIDNELGEPAVRPVIIILSSSDESDEDSESVASRDSIFDASTRSRSRTKIRGRRKLSKPCNDTSHHHLSTPPVLRRNTTATSEGDSDRGSVLNNSKLSVLPKRRSLASINTTEVHEKSTPALRRRRSETRFSEFYSSALKNVGELKVVAERMSWLKLTPLIMPEYPIDFEYIFRNWSMDIVSKLGEGSFSEVYRVRKRFEPGDHFDVFKVIPVGQEGQPTFDDMLPEMSMCLAGRCLLESPRNRAPSFLSLRGTHLVQGALTKEMVAAYEAFRELKPEETEHPHPSERQPKQFYVAFYTSYDGVELEKELPALSANTRASIVLQVTYALAAAELSFEFEHRDLHLSNIVVKETDEEELEFRISGERFGIKSFGKQAALIDYGMCRLVVDEVLHSPFEPEILLGKDLQRRTYKKQHRMLKGNYHERCLETNGLWIFFLIKKLFPKRPLASKLTYGAQVNRLFSELCENYLSARRCVEILENRELNETQSFIL